MPLTCSLLNSDQPRGAIEQQRCIAPLHLLDFDVLSVTTKKGQPYARNKLLIQKVSLNFLHQIIVNNELTLYT